MENIKKILRAGMLEFTLTEDKLFIKGPTGQESFALRSLNGIGIYDDIEKHKIELDNFNTSANPKKATKHFGIVLLVFGLVILMMKQIVIGIVSGGIGAFFFHVSSKIEDPIAPKLESEVRIMLSGGSRNFRFLKEDSNSIEVAEFIAFIEETLTAYNK